MKTQIAKYLAKLLRDGSARAESVSFLAKDDLLLAQGPGPHQTLAEAVLGRLNMTALVLASPSLPIADFLLARTPLAETRFIPRDTETRTFLHDIPIVRRTGAPPDPALLARLLSTRKGILVEGLGILAVGSLTPEQAYINYSSVFHAVFVKYLIDLLAEGFRLPGEREAFEELREKWLRPIDASSLHFAEAPLPGREQILSEIAAAGRATVEMHLVDSAFGNISWRQGDLIYISQTGAHLDELDGFIDPVPGDNSSTAGVTASSELLAHRRIFERTGARAILHGHPKVAVVMSMLCERQDCKVENCWRSCPHVRYLEQIPIVAGEIGAGGLAEKVPPVIGQSGRALVYGHGVFTIGYKGFGEAFAALVEVENWCRAEYCRRLGV